MSKPDQKRGTFVPQASDRWSVTPNVRVLANQMFSRAAGSPRVGGNSVRLLRDAAENYPATLEAIRSARRAVHFESYIIHEDEAGREFADALCAKAREGVRVRLIYDLALLQATRVRAQTARARRRARARCNAPKRRSAERSNRRANAEVFLRR